MTITNTLFFLAGAIFALFVMLILALCRSAGQPTPVMPTPSPEMPDQATRLRELFEETSLH